MGHVNFRTLAFFIPFLLYTVTIFSIRIMLFFTTGLELIVLNNTICMLIYRAKLKLQQLFEYFLNKNHDNIMTIVRILCWPWVAINGIIPPNRVKGKLPSVTHQHLPPRIQLYPCNLLIFSHVRIHMTMLYLWGITKCRHHHITL